MKYIEDLFSLNGMVAIITGAARGNGKAISEALLRVGANVILVDILEEELLRTTAEFNADDLEAVHFVCDITKREHIDNLIKFVKKEYKQIDVLVNNAGVTFSHESLNYPLSDWEKSYQVILKAPFELTKEVGKIMKAHGSGSIINITSINAELAFPDNPAYVTFKGALRQLTRAFALDLGKYGIRANNVGPGYFRTKMTQKSWNDSVKNLKIQEKTVMGRWGEPNDLAGIVIFLASDASSYVTGQDIYVDGGWLIKGL